MSPWYINTSAIPLSFFTDLCVQLKMQVPTLLLAAAIGLTSVSADGIGNILSDIESVNNLVTSKVAGGIDTAASAVDGGIKTAKSAVESGLHIAGSDVRGVTTQDWYKTYVSDAAALGDHSLHSRLEHVTSIGDLSSFYEGIVNTLSSDYVQAASKADSRVSGIASDFDSLRASITDLASVTNLAALPISESSESASDDGSSADSVTAAAASGSGSSSKSGSSAAHASGSGSSSSHASESSSRSSSSNVAVGVFAAPFGAVLGAVAMVLL